MKNGDDFNFMTHTDEIKLVNHNDNNFENFRNFSKRMDSVYDQVDKDRVKQERKNNLKIWDNRLSKPWNQARLKDFQDQKAAEQAEKIIKENKLTNFFIKGGKGSGKTFLALAIIRRYIGYGYLTPSQVVHISEDDFLNIARAGYKMNDSIRELLSTKHKLFLIDNVNSNKIYTDTELSLWSQLFDFVSKNNLKLIFTSKKSARDFLEKLSENSQSKFSYLFDKKIVAMSGVINPPEVNEELTEEEEKEWDEEEAFNNRLGSDLFKD